MFLLFDVCWVSSKVYVRRTRTFEHIEAQQETFSNREAVGTAGDHIHIDQLSINVDSSHKWKIILSLQHAYYFASFTARSSVCTLVREYLRDRANDSARKSTWIDSMFAEIFSAVVKQPFPLPPFPPLFTISIIRKNLKLNIIPFVFSFSFCSSS